MKKKGALQNPVVVIILCGVALGVLYFNTIAPLIANKPAYTSDDSDGDVSMESTPEDMLSNPEEPLSDAPGTIPDLSDTMITHLPKIGWRRTTNRNPFVVHGKQETIVPSAPPAISTKSVVSQQTVSSSPRKRTPLAADKTSAPLQAISRGPGGLIALIGSDIVSKGDTCSFGIVTALDNAAITLRTKNGTRTYRLNKSSSGAAK